jgi:hypothetical protein
LPAGKNDQIPLEILTLYIVSSLTALLTWWLDHDMPYPAEQINDIFRQLTQPSIETIMQGTDCASAVVAGKCPIFLS